MSSSKKTHKFAVHMLSAAISVALANAAFAEESATDESADEDIEELIITGSRRMGVSPTETLSPVDVIGGEKMANQASADMTDSLTKISPSLNTQRFPIADGTAVVRPVTLRNLAPDQTLVLVNGTRRHRSALVNLQLAPLGTVNQGSQAVDFSAFPSGAVKRVEVLRDGAAAQYGSDAIAGVINVILNDESEGGRVGVQYGQYGEGDGTKMTVTADSGFELTADGFAHVSFEYGTTETTDRGKARPDAAAVADIVGAGNVDYDGKGQRWGDPEITNMKLFLNSGLELESGIELFSNASYMTGEMRSGFFYRGPVLDPIHQTAARGTLQVDSDGDFLPDAAPQSLVDSITGQGLTPSDYLVADATSPSGFVLRNPIFSQFPGGYSPKFGADMTDYSFVFGARGENEDGSLSWDVRGRTAKNELVYVISDTINPSLGALSPTEFEPGTLAQLETSFNADFVQTFDELPWNLAYGFEWRVETYEISEGDAASTEVGPTYAQFGLGSDGFQGFDPASAGSFDSASTAAYVDFEGDVTDEFSAAVALRYENYDEFGSTLDYKLSGRYQLSDDFALRSTYSTGFRAPTPGQINTLNVTTTSDSSGNLVPSGTYPVDNPVARALGSEDVDTESSTSFSLGLVGDLDGMSVTVDYYQIEIQDRLGLLSKTVTAADATAITALGVDAQQANLLVGSAASYFANAFDSKVTGVDLSVSSSMDMGDGTFTWDLRHNFNEQEVSNVKADTINGDRIYDLENQVPQNSTVLTADYVISNYDFLVRLNRYGDWSTTGGLFGNGDASDAVDYTGAVLVDVEARMNIEDSYHVTLGVDNLLDTKPATEENGVLDFLGVDYALTSPYGFNGMFWYVRAGMNF